MGSLELFRMRSIVNVLFTFPYFIYKLSTPNTSCPTINAMLTSKPRYVKSGDSKIWLWNQPLPRRERSVFERIDNIADYRPRRVRSAFERTDYIADCRPRRVRSVFERTDNIAITDPVGCVPPLNAPNSNSGS